jgi:hypothetical protein
MIDITELEVYFPKVNRAIIKGNFSFKISLQQYYENKTFVINLKIKQQDTKEEKLIKFRFGIGKDKKQDNSSHQTNVPHFEIDFYNRETFSATLYFTLDKNDSETLLEYCKGTIVLIDKILNNFCEKNFIEKEIIDELIYEDVVLDELSSFEDILIDALYESFKRNELIVRHDGESFVIKTPHNLNKYLNNDTFLPLYQELKEREEK